MSNLTDDQIREKLIHLNSWKIENAQLVKTFTFKDFKTAILAVNQIASISNSFDHHPDIDIRYNKVTFRLFTHGTGGITVKDVNLAENIEKIAVSLI